MPSTSIWASLFVLLPSSARPIQPGQPHIITNNPPAQMNDSLDPILQQEEQRKLRIQLIWRLAIAVALVAGVLGILAWLEQGKESKPQMTVSAPREIRAASAPAASATTFASAPEVSAPAEEASVPQAAASASAPGTAPALVASALPAAVLPRPEPTPQTTTAPALTLPGTKPVSKPVTPVIAQPAAPVVTQPVAPNRPSIAVKPVQPPAEPVQPPRVATPQPAAPPARYPSPVATPNGYTVQAGVFLHSANAEKMLKQVQSAGIPAYLETRVQIGPFSNKTEAEAAVKKLRLIGVEPVLKTN